MTAPLGAAFQAVILPPWFCAIAIAIDNPSPVL